MLVNKHLFHPSPSPSEGQTQSTGPVSSHIFQGIPTWGHCRKEIKGQLGWKAHGCNMRQTVHQI